MSGGKVIATGRQYAIGWYDDWYVIWNVSEPGKPVAFEESRSPEGWKILSDQFFQLESIDLIPLRIPGATNYGGYYPEEPDQEMQYDNPYSAEYVARLVKRCVAREEEEENEIEDLALYQWPYLHQGEECY